MLADGLFTLLQTWHGGLMQAIQPWHAVLMYVIIIVIFVGLARDYAPADVLLLGGTIMAGLLGIINSREVFAGFGNPSMLMVGALFVVAAGLRETGALDLIGHRMLGKARREVGALSRMLVVLTVSSAFLNNTPIVAMFVPILMDWCRKNGVSPSRMLIPLSFMTILGGICSKIGTSTNLVVDGLMRDWVSLNGTGDPVLAEQLRPMGLFELAKVGVPMALIGGAFMLTVGRKLLPDNKSLMEQLGESTRDYLVDMLVQPNCRLIGQTVAAAGLRHLPGLFLIEINRQDRTITPVEPDEIIRAGDRLTFTGVVSTIVDLERIPGLIPAVDDGYETKAADRRNRRLCEAVISSTSPLIGKSIRDAEFRALYNAAVVAVHRGGARLHGRIGDIVMRAGDTLLLQTGPHFVRAHRNNPDFFLVGNVEEARPIRHDRALLAMGLLAVLITLLATQIVPEAVAAFLIAGLMIATRCISASEARQSVDFQTLIAIAASFGLGKAIDASGAADQIAGIITHVTGYTGPTLGPWAALAAVYLVTMLSSELLTNNASAALVFPFAIATAQACEANARPFAMAVAFAASAAFATPIGYQTHMMVWGPGGYKFGDFLKIGLPLDFLLMIAATILIPLAWPF
ncbi:MAG TPA: SLC13 family permease [Phycisphaerae bacterium]|nr:SLC13 family permease [Phycisphaerae bacterium]HOJ53455.1 SLC13 family permease [Phycisphaerae bacterium]HOL25421.1 SLC13 family permease [Phycisphaerae bacterium]HPP19902.1 SLC13 family permease [Phycisphaerae bacterium]HPU31172.1 SLC13 family permease [Phycisphaerae bacterium]